MRPAEVGSLNFVIVICWGLGRSPILLKDMSFGVRVTGGNWGMPFLCTPIVLI